MITTKDYDIMIDCGDGSYLRWQKSGYHWKNLEYIFITHMHPDHTGGLLPFLFYRKIYSIASPLTIIGPPNLEAYLTDSFQHTGINHNQDLHHISIADHSALKLEDKSSLHAREMEHKILDYFSLNELLYGDMNFHMGFIKIPYKNPMCLLLVNK